MALSCPDGSPVPRVGVPLGLGAAGDAIGSGKRIAVRTDPLDTDGDGLPDARFIGFDSSRGGSPEIADDGTMVIRALIQRDATPDEHTLVLLRMASPVCPSFADGFEGRFGFKDHIDSCNFIVVSIVGA